MLLYASVIQTKSGVESQIEIGSCLKRFPQALIIGAPKCGTAALATFLSFHPGVAIDRKRELYFFSLNYAFGFDWYKENLPCSRSDQLVIERTSNYIVNDSAPERVWRMDPKIKIILIVCEPVRRTISHFAMCLAHGKIQNTSFEEFMFYTKDGIRHYDTDQKIAKASNYSLNFPRWLHFFSFEQIHIVDGDKLKTDPYKEVTATEHFLGLSKRIKRNSFVYNQTKGFFCYNKGHKKQSTCLSPDKGRKHPEVDEKTNDILRKFYQPYNEIFFKLSKRRFRW